MLSFSQIQPQRHFVIADELVPDKGVVPLLYRKIDDNYAYARGSVAIVPFTEKVHVFDVQELETPLGNSYFAMVDGELVRVVAITEMLPRHVGKFFPVAESCLSIPPTHLNP